MRTWLEPQVIPVPEDLTASVGGHPLVAQTFARRGILTPEAARPFLDPAYYSPAPPTDLPGLAAAADRLVAAIQQREPICVWGDFDVDGQTATTLLFQTLRDLGAEVRFHIPVREYESHGVNLPMLERVIADGAKLVLTCDTGITAHEAALFARSKGVDFIITDHHELPPALPEALAIVNPKLLPNLGDRGQGLETLPGVGVAYKLAEELYARFGRRGEVIKHADLAALGIVADVAIQTGEARYLVQRGLQVLRKSERVGIQAMMESAELKPAWLTETHIGFSLGPRLNALGRLSDANSSVELFTTDDLSRARVLAATLEGLNAKRQLLTSQVFQAAQAQIEANPALLDDPVLVLAHPLWPAGVIGIVASRLVERYHRPTVLIANPPGERARGSARSIDGVNITAAIAEQKNLLTNFGGHPMAAGLSLDAENIPALRRGLANTLRRAGGEPQVEKPLQVDGWLDLTELSLGLVEDLGRLAPFGPGNPALVLATRSVKLKSHAKIGRGDEHLQLIVEDEHGNRCKVIWWQGAGYNLPEGRFDLAYTVHASDFRGQREVAVEWVDARPLEAQPVHVAAKRPILVVDHRRELQPLAVLKPLAGNEDVQVWCEADAKEKLAKLGIVGRNRSALEAGAKLVIWTTPPGPRELLAALETVSPEVVYLFAVAPEAERLESFLQRLAGLVKYALKNTGGQVSLPALAAATTQRAATVRKGLDWLAARGHLTIVEDAGDEIRLSPGGTPNPAEAERLAAVLRALWEESQAYRAYFAAADGGQLIVNAAKD